MEINEWNTLQAKKNLTRDWYCRCYSVTDEQAMECNNKKCMKRQSLMNDGGLDTSEDFVIPHKDLLILMCPECGLRLSINTENLNNTLQNLEKQLHNTTLIECNTQTKFLLLDLHYPLEEENQSDDSLFTKLKKTLLMRHGGD